MQIEVRLAAKPGLIPCAGHGIGGVQILESPIPGASGITGDQHRRIARCGEVFVACGRDGRNETAFAASAPLSANG